MFIFFHKPMRYAKYLYALDVKLTNEMYKVNELLCRVPCKKIWLLLLIQLKQ